MVKTMNEADFIDRIATEIETAFLVTGRTPYPGKYDRGDQACAVGVLAISRGVRTRMILSVVVSLAQTLAAEDTTCDYCGWIELLIGIQQGFDGKPHPNPATRLELTGWKIGRLVWDRMASKAPKETCDAERAVPSDIGVRLPDSACAGRA